MSIFAQYEGIKGESSDQNHKGWMDIHQLEWGIERKITSATSTQGDRESSNTTITDLTLVRLMDSATPKVFIECCCGTGQDLTLHLTKTGSGSGGDVFMEYKLKNCLISNYAMTCSPDHANRPTERMTISFTRIESKYIPYDENGQALSPIVVGFDTATNTKL